MTVLTPLWNENTIWTMGNSSSQNMNNAGIKRATLFTAHRTGFITHVYVCNSSASSPPTYRASIQGRNPLPDDTPIHADAAATFTGFGSNQAVAVALPNSGAPVTAGEDYAVVVEYDSGTIGASNTFALSTAYPSLSGTAYPIHASHGASGPWTMGSSGTMPILTARYDNGAFIPLTCPMPGFPANNTLASNGSLDQIGWYFTSPITVDLHGARFICGTWDSALNAALVLYDDSDNQLASKSFDETAMINTTQLRIVTSIFDAPYKLQRNANYRLVLRNYGDLDEEMRVQRWTASTSGHWDAIKESLGWLPSQQTTTRLGSGAWTEASGLLHFTPLVDLSSVPVGGGSARPRRYSRLTLPR